MSRKQGLTIADRIARLTQLFERSGFRRAVGARTALAKPGERLVIAYTNPPPSIEWLVVAADERSLHIVPMTDDVLYDDFPEAPSGWPVVVQLRPMGRRSAIPAPTIVRLDQQAVRNATRLSAISQFDLDKVLHYVEQSPSRGEDPPTLYEREAKRLADELNGRLLTAEEPLPAASTTAAAAAAASAAQGSRLGSGTWNMRWQVLSAAVACLLLAPIIIDSMQDRRRESSLDPSSGYERARSGVYAYRSTGEVGVELRLGKVPCLPLGVEGTTSCTVPSGSTASVVYRLDRNVPFRRFTLERLSEDDAVVILKQDLTSTVDEEGRERCPDGFCVIDTIDLGQGEQTQLRVTMTLDEPNLMGAGLSQRVQFLFRLRR